MRRWARLGAPVALLGIVLVGCSSSTEVPSNAAVFSGAPWKTEESYTYNLKRRGEDFAGTCTLTTGIPESGQLKLSRLCGKDEFRDDGSVTVDAITLEPIQSVRVFADSKKNKRSTYTNAYESTRVTFRADLNGSTSDTTRQLPTSTDKVPAPAWYDDEEILWLVRGIGLASGAKADYTLVINAGQPSIHTVNLRVDPVERVTVPAGQFEAWKVRLSRNGNVNYFWVEASGAQRVVKAQIEDLTYELTAAK
ncbi:MAG: hypothetical protein ABI782_12995 [Anaerolineaceae bacterium]